VPPKQCPACGRFLKTGFVDALDEVGAACPGCDGDLTASMFGQLDQRDQPDERTGRAPVVEVAELDPEVSGRAEPMPIPAGGSGDEVSVRPPDLEPDAVRDRSLDVLAGWDVGVGQAEVEAWRRDRRPVPIDTLVVAGAGFTGVVAGLWFDTDHRARGAWLGALTGIIGAATVRRVWRLRT
jgi:hypothetical protein